MYVYFIQSQTENFIKITDNGPCIICFNPDTAEFFLNGLDLLPFWNCTLLFKAACLQMTQNISRKLNFEKPY
jgi:hypothetical protein